MGARAAAACGCGAAGGAKLGEQKGSGEPRAARGDEEAKGATSTGSAAGLWRLHPKSILGEFKSAFSPTWG